MSSLSEPENCRKPPCSERFQTLLPKFVTLLEGEWRDWRTSMDPLMQTLFREAHDALGRLNDKVQR